MHFRQDVLSGFCPHKRFRGHIIVAEVCLNRLNELWDAVEDTTANAPLRQVAEPAFDRVEPRTRRRDEVQMDAWMPPYPPAHGGVLVRRVIVQDQMQIESGGRLRIDLLEEPEKLLVAMARHAVADDRSIEHAQCREECRRAVAFVVVRHCATAALFHREAGLGAVQGLDLAFLIHAQDEGVLRRVQIQAHHIRHFLLKVGIPAELEGADQMGFEAMCLPHALHQRRIGPQMPGQRSRGPVRRGGGPGLGGGVKNLRLQRLPTPGRASTSRGVMFKPDQPVCGKALSPESHRLPTRSHSCGDVPIFMPLGGQQDHRCAQRQSDGGAPAPGPLA